MADFKAPGVYVEERNAFPNSVVPVPTAVPAFIGATVKAEQDGTSLTGIPTRITSLKDYSSLFGGTPPRLCTRDETGKVRVLPKTQYVLPDALRLYFANGGGPCWIVSTGPCVDNTLQFAPIASALEALKAEAEPTLVLAPEAPFMDSEEYSEVCNTLLNHSGWLGDRFALLDIRNGELPPGGVDDPIGSFRAMLTAQTLSYGAAWYPFLGTTLHELQDTDMTSLAPEFAQALSKAVAADLVQWDLDKAQSKALVDAIVTPEEPEARARTHARLLNFSPAYQSALQGAVDALNLLPPSAAIAGVICRTDAEVGPWQAPANTGLTSVATLPVRLDDSDQQDLNAPQDGKAVNAIRFFNNRGILVWGARTLDASSPDWRYIPVRRCVLMIEQSIRSALKGFVFEPNDANTWATVKNMLENFLTGLWKEGALQGGSADDAFSVQVGLGSTMTAQDMADGLLRVTVMVAPVRPAEFIVLTFEQQQAQG